MAAQRVMLTVASVVSVIGLLLCDVPNATPAAVHRSMVGVGSPAEIMTAPMPTSGPPRHQHPSVPTGVHAGRQPSDLPIVSVRSRRHVYPTGAAIVRARYGGLANS